MEATEENPVQVVPPETPVVVALKLEPSAQKMVAASENLTPDKYETMSVGGSPVTEPAVVVSIVLITLANIVPVES